MKEWSKNFMKEFFLDLMIFLTHINVRPNEFLKSIFLCTTIPHRSRDALSPVCGIFIPSVTIQSYKQIWIFLVFPQVIILEFVFLVASVDEFTCRMQGNEPRPTGSLLEKMEITDKNGSP